LFPIIRRLWLYREMTIMLKGLSFWGDFSYSTVFIFTCRSRLICWLLIMLRIVIFIIQWLLVGVLQSFYSALVRFIRQKPFRNLFFRKFNLYRFGAETYSFQAFPINNFIPKFFVISDSSINFRRICYWLSFSFIFSISKDL